MREILFRGKDIITDEWLYGGIVYHVDDYYIIDCTAADMSYPEPEKVMPETVGQYTGLTDKNGVKIFEGDIVRYNGERHIVVFETRGETGYFGIKIDHIETWGFCQSVPAKLMEVIGNIHDNPELAEGLL